MRRLRVGIVLVGLCIAVCSSDAAEPKKLLLLGQGPDGHPPQTHEYAAGLKILAECLKPIKGLEVSIVQADDPWREGPELLARADGVVLFLAEGARWIHADRQRLAAFRRLAEKGGALTALHWAIGTRPAEPVESFVRMFGACHGGPDRKHRVLKARVQLANPLGPITRGIQEFSVEDEFYYRLKTVSPADSIRPVLQVAIDGRLETVAWSWKRPNGGRSFGFSGLHFHKNWRLAEYRRLVAQGVLWTMDIPVPEKGLSVEVPERLLDLRTSH